MNASQRHQYTPRHTLSRQIHRSPSPCLSRKHIHPWDQTTCFKWPILWLSPFQPAYVLALQASENWDKFLELEKYLRCHVPIKFKSVSLTKHCPNLASTHPSLVYPENIYILHAHRAAARCILNGPFCGCRPFSRYRYPFWHSRIHKIGTNSQS